MSLHKTYYLTCTNCNNQAWSNTDNSFIYAESAAEARALARTEGYIYKRVTNGSYWDICPNCIGNLRTKKQPAE